MKLNRIQNYWEKIWGLALRPFAFRGLKLLDQFTRGAYFASKQDDYFESGKEKRRPKYNNKKKELKY